MSSELVELIDEVDGELAPSWCFIRIMETPTNKKTKIVILTEFIEDLII